MIRALFAAAELFPLAKTGGLADVAAALPSMLTKLGVDVRIAVPAYRGARACLQGAQRVMELRVRDENFAIWQGSVPGIASTVWLFECAALYDRDGDPYRDRSGNLWPDNEWRFGCFCEAVAHLALRGIDGWRPDVVHCNDWHTGLVPAWLSQAASRPRTVFTVHNLAFQGLCDHATFRALGLPENCWSIDGAEFYGQLSFMKAGLAYSDALTTVSPTYAREIQTPEQGCGLDGVLRARSGSLHGILNGIDDALWDPAADPFVDQPYDAATVGDAKPANKLSLQRELGLTVDAQSPLLAFIGRLTSQKGADLIAATAPQLLALGCQLVILGAGDKALESRLLDCAAAHSGRAVARVTYDERLAHRIEAGADIFLMPSRYEPCGLNQMYSQRYGTVPVVHRVGGLADSVVDATTPALAAGIATGVQFEHSDPADLLAAIRRAVDLHRNLPQWRSLQLAGMNRDFSWRRPASAYRDVYGSPSG